MGNGPKSRSRRAGKKKRVKRKKQKGGQKMHYISMEPREIRFVDENDNEVKGDEGLMNWKKFLQKVEDHPKWGTLYKFTRHMNEIWEAYKEAVEIRKDWVLVLEDDPYKELKDVCETPKYTYIDRIQGPREVQGWGMGNRYVTQMICFSRQAINATDVDPRKTEEKDEDPEKVEGKVDPRKEEDSKTEAA
jgi:hypothetical protein